MSEYLVSQMCVTGEVIGDEIMVSRYMAVGQRGIRGHEYLGEVMSQVVVLWVGFFIEVLQLRDRR